MFGTPRRWLLLASVLALTLLVACGGEKKEEAKATPGTGAATQAPAAGATLSTNAGHNERTYPTNLPPSPYL